MDLIVRRIPQRDSIRIYPIADVHLGSLLHDKESWNAFCRRVEQEDAYRIKPGNNNDKRLKADETLNAIGDWATGQRPDIGDDKAVVRIEPATRSSLFAVYENGDEDHQILMKMTYEVNV